MSSMGEMERALPLYMNIYITTKQNINKMNKQHYIKPATTVFAVQPLAILAGSGTFKLQSNTVTSGDGDEDVWETPSSSIDNNTTDKN